jgi:hypothetical protein
MGVIWLRIRSQTTSTHGRKFLLPLLCSRVDILELSITTREAEVKEDWKTQIVEQQDKIRGGPLSVWGFGAGDLVKTGEKIVKVSSLS